MLFHQEPLGRHALHERPDVGDELGNEQVSVDTIAQRRPYRPLLTVGTLLTLNHHWTDFLQSFVANDMGQRLSRCAGIKIVRHGHPAPQIQIPTADPQGIGRRGLSEPCRAPWRGIGEKGCAITWFDGSTETAAVEIEFPGIRDCRRTRSRQQSAKGGVVQSIHIMAAQQASSGQLWPLWLLLIFPAIFIGIPLFARVNVGRERLRLVQWATPFLEPGEQIQAVFKVGMVKVFGNSRHLDAHRIAATNRAILVLHVDWGHASPPRRLAMRYARNIYFGRPARRRTELVQSWIVLDGHTLVVPKRFFTDVAAADAALDEMNRVA